MAMASKASSMATPAANPSDRLGAAKPSDTSPVLAAAPMKRTVRGTASVARASARRPRNFITERYAPEGGVRSMTQSLAHG